MNQNSFELDIRTSNTTLAQAGTQPQPDSISIPVTATISIYFECIPTRKCTSVCTTLGSSC